MSPITSRSRGALTVALSSTVLFSMALSLGILAAPAPAAANGFEISGAGTRPLGRAGAYAARADDSLALAVNPALLADLDHANVSANLHMNLWDACVARTGGYPDVISSGVTVFDNANPDWYTAPYARVCNSGMPQFVPQVTAGFRIADGLGIGFGILAPNSVGTSRWGNADGTFMTPNNVLVPTPTRYLLTSADLLLFHPSIGIGYRVNEILSFGLTLHWGIAIIDYSLMTNTGPNEDPSTDILTRLQVTDAFIPGATVSVHVRPTPNFDLMASARFSDSIGGVASASGTLGLRTGTYGVGGDTGYTPTDNTLQNVTLEAGQPFYFTLAGRYADRHTSREACDPNTPDANGGLRRCDGLATENFDVELDALYEHLSQVQDFVVGIPNATATVTSPGGSQLAVPVPPKLPLPHGWSDVLTLRLGSDINVIRNQLAVRVGVSGELPLSNSYVRYMNADFMGGARLGLHVGGTLRVGPVDVSIGYGLVLAETIVNANGNARHVGATGNEGQCTGAGGATYDASRPVSSIGCYPQGFGAVVNSATYSQTFHQLSLGANIAF